MKNNFKTLILLIIVVTIGGVMYFAKKDQDSLFHLRLVNDSFVEHGDGLIIDDVQTGLDKEIPFASKYYFKGKDVNNYFKYNNLCFRIVNITSDNYIKVMYMGTSEKDCSNIVNKADKMAFDTETNQYSNSSIKGLFSTFSDKLYDEAFDFDLIVDATWYMGSIKMSGNQLSENIKYERGLDSKEDNTYESKLGLISITDYLKAGCGKSVYDAIETCGDNNFLYNDINYWTMNSVLWDTSNVYTVTNGMPKPMQSSNQNYYAFPSLYLKANLEVTGKGTAENPYKLK